MLASCPAGSEYDEVDDTCFIDCTDLTNDECDELDLSVFGEFDDLIDSAFEGQSSGDDEPESTVLAEYSVDRDLNLTELDIYDPAADVLFRQIWKSAVSVLPRTDIQRSVATYLVETDGESEILAYVVPDDSTDGKWIMSFDNADYVDGKGKEFIHTIIHEFGHILFLRDGQVDMSVMGNCANFSIEEGCTTSDSHLNKYFEVFWADIIDEHAAVMSSGESSDPVLEFYDRYEERFVSEYSATNPVEDAAEIFTHFVLRDKPTDKMSVVSQKILFMHGVDELSKKRDVIRGKLSTVQTN